MNDIIALLSGKNFHPHGYCFNWQHDLLALHIFSDLAIFLAYLLIPVLLGFYLVKKGDNLKHRAVLALFVFFILGCGFTHLFGVITVWYPWYYLAGFVKFLTAIVSLATVAYLYPLIPQLINLPSIDEIMVINEKLKQEILLREQKESELIESQKALRSSNVFTDTLLNSMPDSIISMTELGEILSFNKAAEKLFQYQAAEVIGHNIKMLMPETYAHEHDNYLAHYRNAGKLKKVEGGRELMGRCKNGSTFNMRLGISETLINEQRVLCGIIQSISAEKQKELALKYEIAERKASALALTETKALQTAILNNIVDGIITIDDKGLVLSFNKAAENIFKYQADEVIGHNVSMLMPKPYALEHDGYLTNYITTRQRKVIGIGREVIGLCKDGSTFPMDLAVSEVKFNNQRVFAGIVRDITERKQIESKNKQFEAIIQSSDDAIISKTLDGIITSWNPGAAAMFGYTADEMIGQSMLALLPSNRQQEEITILERIRDGKKVEHFETIRLCKDGSSIDISATISPIHDSNGNVIGASKIARNISAQKKTEACLVEAKEAAEVANKAKSEFLANMSHEIRTPLNGVIGMIELVIDTELNSQQKRFLSIANQSAELLLNVINDILDFSKIEAKKLDLSPHPFNLRDSIENTVSTLAMRAHDKNLEMVCAISPELPETLIADSLRLQQVLINLIGNAIKFTEQGEIVVRVEKQVALTQSDATLYLHISVQDSGIGIAEDKQKQIFSAFVQSDASMTRSYGGTGLGLAISQHLVELMGGKIWIESKLGKGSTFHFIVQCGIENNSANKILNTFKTELNNIKVLIIDDNSTNCLVLYEMLSSWGMRPFSIEKPQKALEILKQADSSGEAFKLVITDYQMPELTGLGLAKQIRENADYKTLPIIVLSSVSSISELEQLEKNTLINCFIEKPVRQSTLLECIQSVLSETQVLAPTVEAFKPNVNLNPKLKILVAEDNLTNQIVIQGFFEKQGLTQVTMVDNGQKAVAAYQNGQFDVIFMDVRMPEMDGFQATEAIRDWEKSTNQHIPIIALTANALKDDEALCLSKGMDYYTSKPIKPNELLKILAVISATLPDDVDAKCEDFKNLDEPAFNLQAALNPVGGDIDIFKRVIGVFLKTSPPLFEKLKQAVLAKDSERILDSAHTLKGAACNFAAQPVVTLAAQLEHMGNTKMLEDAETVLAQLEIELTKLANALEKFKHQES